MLRQLLMSGAQGVGLNRKPRFQTKRSLQSLKGTETAAGGAVQRAAG